MPEGEQRALGGEERGVRAGEELGVGLVEFVEDDAVRGCAYGSVRVSDVGERDEDAPVTRSLLAAM